MEVNTDIKKRVSKLVDLMSQGLFEKHHIMAMALLSAVAGESIFLLGPPGTAKSMVARRLKMAFKDATAFEYLMSRFSVPDEVFGPVSISKLKDEDLYERQMDGYLPTAEVVFLDEIWKAGPSILNALLTAINERIFKNGQNTIKLPMKALIAASNELPAEGEGLEALWDRFLVRMISDCISSEAVFYKMIRQQKAADPVISEAIQIDDGTLAQWQSEIAETVIPDDICKMITSIRKAFAEASKGEDVNPMDYYTSDRRWKKCFHLMQTSAFLNGRDTLDVTDVLLLSHCLWNNEEMRENVSKIVGESIAAHYNALTQSISKKVYKLLDNMLTVTQKYTPAIPMSMPAKGTGKYKIIDYLYYELENFPEGRCFFAKYGLNKINSTSDTIGTMYLDPTRHGVFVIQVIKPMGSGTPVRLRSVSEGIMVDGVIYRFITEESLFKQVHDQQKANTIPSKMNNAGISGLLEQIKQEKEPYKAEEDPNLIGLEEYKKKITEEVISPLGEISALLENSDNIFVEKEALKPVKAIVIDALQNANSLVIKIQSSKTL